MSETEPSYRVSVAQRRTQFNKRSTIPDLKPIMRDRFGDYYQVNNHNNSSSNGRHRANHHIIKASQQQDSSDTSTAADFTSTRNIKLEQYNKMTGSPGNDFILPLKSNPSPLNHPTLTLFEHEAGSYTSHTTKDFEDDTMSPAMIASLPEKPEARKTFENTQTLHTNLGLSSPAFSTTSDSSSILSDLSPITFPNHQTEQVSANYTNTNKINDLKICHEPYEHFSPLHPLTLIFDEVSGEEKSTNDGHRVAINCPRIHTTMDDVARTFPKRAPSNESERKPVDEKFTGIREGFVYRQGSRGMAYYAKAFPKEEKPILHYKKYMKRRRRNVDSHDDPKSGCRCM